LITADLVGWEAHPWGRLSWRASRSLGNSAHMTLGRCVIDPGQENPLHLHPNCEEIVEVLTGSVVHRVGEHRVVLHPGDLLTVPAGMPHNARNQANEPAELLIVFSTADREVVRLA
jgi:quercetin dioxygenase-like cupin family protein